MSVVSRDNSRKVLLTTLILVLSMLACALPVLSSWTTPPTTVPDNTQASKPVLSGEPTTPETAVVTASEALHVRKEPGHDKLVIGYLYHDNTVVMTGQCSDDPAGWAQIEWKQGTAWVNADYLSDNKCNES